MCTYIRLKKQKDLNFNIKKKTHLTDIYFSVEKQKNVYKFFWTFVTLQSFMDISWELINWLA